MFKHKSWWSINLLVYLIVFTVVLGLLFGPYFLTGTSFVWQADSISQHVPALVHWQNDLKHLLATGQWPAQWNFQLGIGADYYQTFAYYTLGDIFTYGVAFVSQAHLMAYYNIMIVVRIFLAGIAFLVALHHFTDSRNPWVNVTATLAYVFTGYMALSAFSHPYFVNPLIIFPLLIVAIDNLLNPEKPKSKYLYFIVMVAWTLWNNYYFAFIMALGALIFFVVKTTLDKQWLKLTYWLKIIIPTIIALLIPMALFLPGLMGLFTSARTNPVFANGLLLYPLSYYLELPATFITNVPGSSFWLTGGYSVLCSMGAIYTLRRFKTYPVLNSILVIGAMMLLSPVFAAIMNGASSPSNRWTFMFTLPMALTVPILLNNLKKMTNRDFYWIIGFFGVAFLSLFYAFNFNFGSKYASMLFIAFAMLVLVYVTRTRPKGLYLIVLLAMFNALTVMQQNRTIDLDPNQSNLLPTKKVEKLIDNQSKYFDENKGETVHTDDGSTLETADALQKNASLNRSYIQSPLGNISGMISPAANLAMNGSAHSIETYWSYENGAPAKLFNNIQLLGNSNNDITGNFDRRAVISNLMGIKYWFVNNGGANPPATYKPISDKKINNQTVTKSDDVYPLAYTTDRVVSTKTFNRASPTKKEAYVAQGAVTNALPESATSDQFANQVKSVKIKKSANAKATQTVHYRFTSKNGAKPTGIYLPADASLAGNEIHLEVSNLKFKPFSLYQKATYATNAYNGKAKKAAALPDGKTDYATNTKAYKFNWLRNHANSIGKFVDGYRVTAKYGRTERIFGQRGQNNLSYYSPAKDATLNMGPAKGTSQQQFIPFSFDTLGTYSFDVNVKTIPVDQRFDAVAQRAQANAVPLDIKRDAITGTVNVKKPQILVTSIPYSTGWQSDHNDIINVNDGFVGIKLKTGTNQLNLKYQTPGLHLGLILSIIGIALLLIFSVVLFFL